MREDEIKELCEYAEVNGVELEYQEMGFLVAGKGKFKTMIDMCGTFDVAKGKIDRILRAEREEQ